MTQVGTGASVRVPGFLPSTHGLHFSNSFPDGPAITVNVGRRRLGIGNAANGLCGGMVFAVLDYWTHGLLPPGHVSPPAPATPFFSYLVRRLLDSWHLPSGPLKYLGLMSPWLPDADERRGPVNVRGRAWRILMREWPAIKADLDMGVPVPLGLVRVKSANPLALGHNHQVLAYGYDVMGSAVTLSIYDPNLADADQVTLSLDLGNPGVRVPITMHPDGDLVSFFRVPYVAKDPLVE
jgi:hypothetical protein